MQQQILDFIVCFTSIFYEALPFIVLGSVISGVLEEFVPQQWIARLVPRSRLVAVGMGGFLGLLFPMCECGIVPVMRRLLRKGLPLGTCVAYMLAGPVINGVVILSTVVAFASYGVVGYWIIGLRLVMAYVTAVVTALVADRMYAVHGDALLTDAAKPEPKKMALSLNVVEDGHAEEKSDWMTRLGRVSSTALGDFIDITVFLTLGALLSSLARMFVTPSAIEEWSSAYPALAILSMMLLAIVLCLCSEADAFVAASFTTMHPAAKIAFLVLGPMQDLKLFVLFTRVFRPRLVWAIVSVTFVQVFVYSMAIYFAWPYLMAIFPSAGSIPTDGG